MADPSPHPTPLSNLPSLEVHDGPTTSDTSSAPTGVIAPSSSPLPTPYPPYPHLLSDYQHAPPLPDEKSALDQKSYINPPNPRGLSTFYSAFPAPLFITGTEPSKFLPGMVRPLAAWDVHVYFPVPGEGAETQAEALYARHLWERIRYEFPELRIYRIWERPIGPHTLPMFEVNIFTPAQYGAFVPWLAIHRGPLRCLVHPNTERGQVWDHTVGAVWLGERVDVDVEVLRAEDRGEGMKAGVVGGGGV